MRWPWLRKASHNRLALSWSGQSLAYVLARAQADGQHRVARMGVEHQGTDSADAFASRLRRLGLKASQVHAMLHLDQYQLLQIATPAVPPEELRAAARYQIREMVDAHLDDITLDIMQVGQAADNAQQSGGGQLYVVTAHNAVLREVIGLGESVGWDVSVIDIQETAQRNLQSMPALSESLQDRAHAALVVSERQALLTICAGGELYYSRRLEISEGFLDMKWLNATPQPAAEVDSFTPVAEYVPSYAETSTDFSTAASPDGGSPDYENAQRFLVEVQRSLDVWDRTWSAMPLAALRVYAGARSADLAQWLSQEMGNNVTPLDLDAQFTGLSELPPSDQALCLPLLGMLMRAEQTTL